MSALSLPFVVRYPYASEADPGHLRLATALVDDQPSPFFFSGRLNAPVLTAEMLRAMMQVVQTRYHIPAAMLGRVVAAADPVVTSSEDCLRFEGFSGCCGVYARVDLLPDAIDGDQKGRGTTNVDFNPPMLAALATMKTKDDVQLDIGNDSVELTKGDTKVIEKKVALPVRWLKGFVEVAAVQRRMDSVYTLSGKEAWRFFRALPRMKTNRRETYVVTQGSGLRLTQVPSANAVRVGGLERLRVLESLAAQAESLTVCADSSTGASSWVLNYEHSRFTLAVSPEVWRGFSGEGQVLDKLAQKLDTKTLSAVRARLRWDATIDQETLLADLGRMAFFSNQALLPDQLDSALATLASQGLIGFDVLERAWFHRELPFNFEKVEKMHPRLRDARKLLSEDRIRIGESTLPNDSSEFYVRSSNIEHRVRHNAAEFRCSCPWFARHGVARGACKHILAVQMYLEELTEHE